MADKSGEADIRSLNIDKLARGFADEENILKNFVRKETTNAREIRTYQKTSGFLDTATTNDTSISLIPTSQFARPFAIEQSWTRNTDYVKDFMVESPWISLSDIKDNDIDILNTNVRDIVRAVQRKVDLRIFAILTNALAATPTLPLTGSVTVQNTEATGDGWDDDVAGNPIKDIMVGQRKIRQLGYDPRKAVIGMNSIEHELLLNYLINVKGSSIPSFAVDKLRAGAVMEILGNDILVSENFTTDWVYQWIPEQAMAWKSFTALTAARITEELIGVKIRVLEQGEGILTDPNAVHIIKDTTAA